MCPSRLTQPRSKTKNRLRSFTDSPVHPTVSKAISLTVFLAFPLALLSLNAAHAAIHPPSKTPNTPPTVSRETQPVQNQCAKLIEPKNADPDTESTLRQAMTPQQSAQQNMASNNRPPSERLADYLNEIFTNVENRFVEANAAADAITVQFTREFLFDYQDYISSSLRLPQIANDQRQNSALIQTAKDYASNVDELNKAIAAISEREASPAQWPARLATKLAPKFFDRAQDNAKANRYSLADRLDKKADETIENARAQHEALLIRTEENQDAIEELNIWLNRIKQESSFMSHLAQELALDKSRRTDQRERDMLDLAWSKIQTIRRDLHNQEENLRNLRVSLLTLDQSNKDASLVFSKILTLKRLDFKPDPREITINANSENALQAPDKNYRLMAREDVKRPLPQGTRRASIFDLQRPLVIGEEVLLASFRTLAIDASTDDYYFRRGSRLTVASKQKSYFITINPFTFATPIVFSPIAQIFRGQLPEPLLSYVRCSHLEFDDKSQKYHETQNNVPRQAVAIATTDLIYRGFRVSDVYRGANSIDGQFTIRGFTYWGNILVSHFRETVSGGVTTWHVYSPRELRRQIQKGLLLPHVLNNISESTSTGSTKAISQEAQQKIEAQ